MLNAPSIADRAEAVEARSPDAGDNARSSYRQILSSSAVMAASSLATVLIGIARTKAMALLLGPAGFGLMGLLNAIADMVRSLVEMGINNSGVRQIAASATETDRTRVALTAAVLRRTALVLGLAGALLLWLLAEPIAALTFGSTQQTAAVSLLAFAIFFKLVADAHAAQVQGLRRVVDFAKIGVAGALLGSIAGIVLVAWLGEKGVAAAIGAMSVGAALASWWYSRKLRLARVPLSLSATWYEASALLKLGAAFMVSGFAMLATAYVVRLLVVRHEGLEAAGLYQAAWTLGGMYVGFVLQAMGADFYPRLVGAAADRTKCNRLVNEQALISITLAAAGVLATITLAPFVLRLFYSSAFEAAVETLRWMCLGMALRVASWPIGYIIVARAEQNLFIATELAWALVNIGLTWLCLQWFGLHGAGVAFFASYVFHLAMVYFVARRLSGFRWSASTFKALVAVVVAVGAAQIGFQRLDGTLALALGASLTTAAALCSAWILVGIAKPHWLARWPSALRPSGEVQR